MIMINLKPADNEVPGRILRTRSEDYENKERLFNLSDYVDPKSNRHFYVDVRRFNVPSARRNN